MAVDRNNPGIGDPWAISATGLERMLQAAAVRQIETTVKLAASTASEHWRGVARTAFDTSVEETLPDLTVLAASLDATAGALFVYSRQVAEIKDAQEDLELRRARLQEEQEDLTAKRDMYSAPAFGQPGEFYDIAGLAQTFEQELQDLEPQLSQVDEEWDELVRRRERADADFIADLNSGEVRGNVAALTRDYLAGTSPAQLLVLLEGMSAADLSVLAAVHPEVLDRIRQAPPAEVASWWAGLEGESGRAIQERLVEKIPTLIGSLGGIPPLARVAANRFIAEDRLAAVDTKIADMAAEAESMRRATPGYYTDRAGQLELLENERTYLQRAIDGKVQLYLYEPDRGNIIEMFGDVDDADVVMS
ncbi:MAG: hypothetical protein WBX17_09770, partial [Microbacterium sp.]